VSIALVTTTIQVPEVLGWYREIGPDVPFYVIGDEQAPHDEIRAFCERNGSMVYYSDEDQHKLGYESSELLGWRCTGRRSIGLLEAVKHGASIVVMIDDDNIPLDRRYFDDFAEDLSRSFSGLVLGGRWADPGGFLIPPVHHRGFPHELWHPDRAPAVGYGSGIRVGVSAGLWLGDPDIDAVTRIAARPLCTGVSPAAAAGLAVAPGTYAPFNSQNTAFARDLLPVMTMLPGAGRYDDIWASYVAQRVMREFGWSVRYGRPLVWQERNTHTLSRDLAAETRGMRDTLPFTAALDDVDLSGAETVLDAAGMVYGSLEHGPWRDTRIGVLGAAWVRDCAKVLAASTPAPMQPARVTVSRTDLEMVLDTSKPRWDQGMLAARQRLAGALPL